jgi:crotonobetainyl-CoA:carnitine CoA-transferase CaiB-like acyl-CoA transferase
MENIKPLQNVTVLEIGTSLAEQLVGRHLQLLGARVITLSKSNYILTSGKELANLDEIEYLMVNIN